mmetsp:Transcript_12286/g.23019  ORF Transcript_12286/g.23019 Transcript_12286/m.23019 type:complete len:82 (+) Transcript_12286:896-1141(+)
MTVLMQQYQRISWTNVVWNQVVPPLSCRQKMMSCMVVRTVMAKKEIEAFSANVGEIDCLARSLIPMFVMPVKIKVRISTIV